jgi:tetratricopeptide (TPR) repeat protein
MRRLSARAQRVASKAAWRLLDRNRNLFRRTFLYLSEIRWARGAAAVAEQTIAYAYRRGLRATFVRIRVELDGRVPTKVGPNRDAALLTDTAVPNYDRATIEDIDPGAPLAELEASATTAAEMPADETAPALVSTKADDQIGEALRAVRLVRGLEAMEEILGSYETQVLTGLSSSAPLALVRTLRRNWCGDGVDARSVVETTLRNKLKVHPADPEVLTELGYLLLDAGRLDEAIAALSASASSNSSARSAADARAKAATELGEIYSGQGRFEVAAAAFELAISLAPVTSATRYQYGEALRRLGRTPAAVDAFARAMTASHPTWAFPNAGRDARLIKVDFQATRPRSS